MTAQKSIAAYNWSEYQELSGGNFENIEIVGNNSSKFSAKTGGGCYCIG